MEPTGTCDLTSDCVRKVCSQSMHPHPAKHLLRYRVQVSGGALVCATKAGLCAKEAGHEPSTLCGDGCVSAVAHHVWIPFPVIAFSLPQLVNRCDVRSAVQITHSVDVPGDMVDLTQIDDDDEVIDLTGDE